MTRVKKERKGFAERPVRSTGIYVSPASDSMYDLVVQIWPLVAKWLVSNRLAALNENKSYHMSAPSSPKQVVVNKRWL